MTTGRPSQTQVTELLGAEFARAGYEIEDVVIDARTSPPRITVIADGDTPLDLDTIAALSQTVSTVLDGWDGWDSIGPGIGDHYVLEVSSPGVDRPLTSAKHFRRAHGRKVQMTLLDGSVATGRVGETRDDAVALVVRDGRGWAVREIALTDVITAVVQVEFSPPSPVELALAQTPLAGETAEETAGKTVGKTAGKTVGKEAGT